MLPRNLSASIDALARQAVGKDWGFYALLLERWRDIVGEDFARQTTPVKISFPRGKATEAKWVQGRRTDGTLHVRLPHGLSLSFSYKTDQIRQRIADAFGYPAIARIVLEPYYPKNQADTDDFLPPPELSPQQKAALETQLETVENEELRQLLQQLGESVLKNK